MTRGRSAPPGPLESRCLWSALYPLPGAPSGATTEESETMGFKTHSFLSPLVPQGWRLGGLVKCKELAPLPTSPHGPPTALQGRASLSVLRARGWGGSHVTAVFLSADLVQPPAVALRTEVEAASRTALITRKLGPPWPPPSAADYITGLLYFLFWPHSPINPGFSGHRERQL